MIDQGKEGTHDMNITSEQLDEMLAGCEGVTRGTWRSMPIGNGSNFEDVVVSGHRGPGKTISCAASPRDAAHIANCDPDTIRALITELKELRAREAVAVSNIQAGWSALAMVREAVETLGPVGSMPSSEHVCCAVSPEPHAEAEAIIAGIQKIEACGGTAEISRLRDALLEVGDAVSAAYAEGLSDRLAELDDEPGSIRDLVVRRLLYVHLIAHAALEIKP